MTITHVIFDADGTLLDSLPPHVEFLHTLNKELDLKIQDLPQPRNIEDCRTIADAPMCNFFKKAKFPLSCIERCVKEYERRFSSECTVSCFPGVEQMIHKLSLQNITCIIISSNTSKNVRNGLGKTLSGCFESINGIDNAPRSKRDAIKETLARLQINPRNCIYVGDTIKDYKESRAASVEFIGCNYGFENLSDTNLDNTFIANDVEELTRLVSNFDAIKQKSMYAAIFPNRFILSTKNIPQTQTSLEKCHYKWIQYHFLNNTRQHDCFKTSTVKTSTTNRMNISKFCDLLQKIIQESINILEPIYLYNMREKIENNNTLYLRQSLWRGYISCFVYRIGGKWTISSMKTLLENMKDNILSAESRIHTKLKNVKFKFDTSETSLTKFKKVVGAINVLLKSNCEIHQRKKADLEWGNNLWEIFEENYPPNCCGIESLVLSLFSCHNDLSESSICVGLAPDHSIFHILNDDKKDKNKIYVDIVGTVNKLSVDVIDEKKMYGFRYALNTPEWIYGQDAMYMHCIFDLLGFDRNRVLIKNYKSHQESYCDMEYYRKLSLHEDPVLEALYDNVILDQLVSRLDFDKNTLENQKKFEIIVNYLQKKRILELSFCLFGKKMCHIKDTFTTNDTNIESISCATVLQIIDEFYRTSLLRLYNEKHCLSGCISCSSSILEYVRYIISQMSMNKRICDKTISFQMSLLVKCKNTFHKYIACILGSKFRYMRGTAYVKFGSDADTLTRVLNPLIRVLLSFLQLLRHLENNLENNVTVTKYDRQIAIIRNCAISMFYDFLLFWDCFKIWFHNVSGLGNHMTFLCIQSKGKMFLKDSIISLFECIVDWQIWTKETVECLKKQKNDNVTVSEQNEPVWHTISSTSIHQIITVLETYATPEKYESNACDITIKEKKKRKREPEVKKIWDLFTEIDAGKRQKKKVVY